MTRNLYGVTYTIGRYVHRILVEQGWPMRALGGYSRQKISWEKPRWFHRMDQSLVSRPPTIGTISLALLGTIYGSMVQQAIFLNIGTKPLRSAVAELVRSPR